MITISSSLTSTKPLYRKGQTVFAHSLHLADGCTSRREKPFSLSSSSIVRKLLNLTKIKVNSISLRYFVTSWRINTVCFLRYLRSLFVCCTIAPPIDTIQFSMNNSHWNTAVSQTPPFVFVGERVRAGCFAPLVEDNGQHRVLFDERE
jgi:hypothetical protein